MNDFMKWLHDYGILLVMVQVAGLYAIWSVDRFKLTLLWKWYCRVHGINGSSKEKKGVE